MTPYAHIHFEVGDAIARLTLNRPGRLNALTPGMLDEMADALDRAPVEGARVLLLKGEGRAFCSGADLQPDDGSDPFPEDVGLILERHYNPVMMKLQDLPIPVVCATQVAVAGAGCGLALAADFVIAARSAYFLLAFVNVGLVPDAGSTWIVPRLVGQARAAEMMMLGERLMADKAEQWGLIHRAVEADDLGAVAEALAMRLAAAPTVACGLIRKGLRMTASQTLAQTLDQERRHQALAGSTADFSEGVAAFTQRRPARFIGA